MQSNMTLLARHDSKSTLMFKQRYAIMVSDYQAVCYNIQNWYIKGVYHNILNGYKGCAT